MPLDVARIRGLFPALGDGWVHLDAYAGMSTPEQVTTAVSAALRAPVSAPGGAFPASGRVDAIVDAARRAVAELVGADPAGVVLGPSVEVLLERLADALGTTWLLGDDVVVSRLDDSANVLPWVRAARRCGGTVHWAEVDIETCELPAWQYDDLVTARTRVVAVTAASDAVGTRPDLHRIAEATRKVGALLVVNGACLAPFLPVELNSLAADVLAVSALGWGGPPVAALVFRDPSMVATLPSCSLNPHATGPERLELGPHPYPLLAGLVASVDYLAELDDAAAGTRRERLLTSMGAMEAYHSGLLSALCDELRDLWQVTLIGDPSRRVPVVAFALRSMKAEEAVEKLAQRGLCVFADNGESGVFGALGVGEIGGVVRIGLAHYTTAGELDHLVRVVAELR